MVATDVASRGIGMVDRNTALPPSRPSALCEASHTRLRFALSFSAFAAFWSRLDMILSSRMR